MKKLLFYYSLLLVSNSLFSQGNWNVVSGPPPNLGRFDDISFSSDSIGWTGQNGSIYKSTDKGNTWILTNTFDAGAYIRSIEFLNDTLGFVGTLPNNGVAHLYQTTNGGNSFVNIDSTISGPHSGICGLAHSGNFIIGVGVYSGPAIFIKSSNAGKTWVQSDLSTILSGLVECQMLDTNTYLLGGIGLAPNKRAVILKTTDGGTTWQQVAISAHNTTYTWKIEMLQSGVGYATVEDFGAAYYFKTLDNGNTWIEHSITTNSNIYNLGAVGFITDSIGWFGMQHNPGMAITTNGGSSWTYQNFGTHINRIIKIDSVTLMGCGGSIYNYDILSGIVRSEHPQKMPAHEIKVSPNPASKMLTATITLFSTTMVVLDILDAKAIGLKQIYKGVLAKGEHSFKLDVSDFSNANYYLYLRSNEGHYSKKFVVLH